MMSFQVFALPYRVSNPSGVSPYDVIDVIAQRYDEALYAYSVFGTFISVVGLHNSSLAYVTKIMDSSNELGVDGWARYGRSVVEVLREDKDKLKELGHKINPLFREEYPDWPATYASVVGGLAASYFLAFAIKINAIECSIKETGQSTVIQGVFLSTGVMVGCDGYVYITPDGENVVAKTKIEIGKWYVFILYKRPGDNSDVGIIILDNKLNEVLKTYVTLDSFRGMSYVTIGYYNLTEEGSEAFFGASIDWIITQGVRYYSSSSGGGGSIK